MAHKVNEYDKWADLPWVKYKAICNDDRQSLVNHLTFDNFAKLKVSLKLKK